MTNSTATTRLFDLAGRRKYLTEAERERFAIAAVQFCSEIEALCLLLHFTGARLSEVLALRWEHIDFEGGVVALLTLKQRRSGVYRVVPIPPMLIAKLDRIRPPDNQGDTPIFTWHRATAWEKVKAVMARAGIEGAHATPRGVRHGFGVAALSAGAPLTLVSRWLGHARLETTAIYLAVAGPEERRIASRLWRQGVRQQISGGKLACGPIRRSTGLSRRIAAHAVPNELSDTPLNWPP